MSIEIGTEYSELLKIRREKSRQTVFSEQAGAAAASAVCDRGISYIRFEWDETEFEEPETIRVRPANLIGAGGSDELIRFHKDPDYEDEVDFGFDSFKEQNRFDEDCGSHYDSLLPYDYETDVVDALNLDEQIAAYAANSWEFVSMAGNIILFQRPKWEA
ncbi:hypothetical protein MmiAt1_04530 [Methanimicrococcus sp. At1]|uniref:Uncharacterized protein n=1 Tax=Methanimicrococcus hacksteinii TaxID=3028293 RepID=A0ABU3VNE9_9EURY|nr:hypothetical protein [Methanimicrococcus sp. At1]MDV0444907.1 hypothetical protein [Methanimicrococcus sp. At1]